MQGKKVIAAMLFIVAAVSFSGCGSRGEEQLYNNSSEEVVETKENDAVSVYGADGMAHYYEPQFYEKYFQGENKQYIHDDLSEWRDKQGDLCYPKDFPEGFYPNSDDKMAASQLPEELFKELDTEQLYLFLLEYPPLWSVIKSYDHTLEELTMLRQYVNAFDELMSREDCEEVVEKYYKKYPEKYRQRNTGTGEGTDAVQHKEKSKDLKQVQFQFTEGLRWYFMKQHGKELPDEATYYVN